ncbi:hypothetical protein OQA88_689 [Cercophora sp. LCS_1]
MDALRAMGRVFRRGWRNASRLFSCWSHFFSHQRVLLWTAFATCFSVFIINLVLTILAYTTLTARDDEKFVRDLYNGDCQTAETASQVAHAIINLLSSWMLWASNLAMQLAASPDRAAVGKAHKERKWFDIGVLSVHNLKSMPAANLVIWIVLATSSLPIHFLYNSVVFNTLSATNWANFVVTPDFFAEPPSPLSIEGPIVENTTTCGQPIPEEYEKDYDLAAEVLQDYLGRRDSYKNITLMECFETFNNPFQYRPPLLMVTKNPSGRSSLCHVYKGIPDPFITMVFAETQSLESVWGYFESGGLCMRGLYHLDMDERWSLCGLLETDSPTEEQQSKFRFGGEQVDHCIYDDETLTPANQEQHMCRLQCSPTLLAGDAVASFLEQPDQYTKDFGVTTNSAARNAAKVSLQPRGSAIIWRKQAVRWWHAVEPESWVVFLVTSSVALGGAAFCVRRGVDAQIKYSRDSSIRGLWALGFGDARTEALISWDQKDKGALGLFENLVIANFWQVVLSLLYTASNIIFTTQLVAHEWDTLGNTAKPQGLRVSKPKGEQRSTYYLSMPRRYAVPTALLFYAAHFLASQSTFIIRVIRYDWNGQRMAGRTLAGYSPFPSVLGLIFTSVLFASYIFISIFRRYHADPRMPIVGTNSLAISANCHPPNHDKNPHLKPVSWGVDASAPSEHGRRCTTFSV